MYPRKTSQSKKTISTSQQHPRFILKQPEEDLNVSYLEMYQQNKNPQQKLQQILQKQIKTHSVEDEGRLSKQQFINRSQQVVRTDVLTTAKNNKFTDSQSNVSVSYIEPDYKEENRTLKGKYKYISAQLKKVQFELQQSRSQNQQLINDFEVLRDQLERQSEEFNQAFELMNEEKQLVQQELDQKDALIAQLRSQQPFPQSKTQLQIDEIKNRILARKSLHRSSRETIHVDVDIKENIQDYNNRMRR